MRLLSLKCTNVDKTRAVCNEEMLRRAGTHQRKSDPGDATRITKIWDGRFDLSPGRRSEGHMGGVLGGVLFLLATGYCNIRIFRYMYVHNINVSP